MSKLFRRQVLDKNKTTYYGKAVITTPIHYSIILFFISLFVLSIFIFLFCSDYAKKEKVKGYLVPTNGLARVYSHTSGVVSQIAVKEGDIVNQGDTLLFVSNDKFLQNSLNSDKEKIKELDNQINIVNGQLVQYDNLFKERESRLNSIINFLKQEQVELAIQGKLLRNRVQLAKERLTDIKKLQSDDYASQSEVKTQFDLVLDFQQRIQEYNTVVLKSETNLANALNDKARLPFEKQQKIDLFNIELSKLSNNKVAILESNNLVLKAPISGVISSIKLNVGEFAFSGDYLVTIIPTDSKLEAEVFVPTRAIAFIKEEEEVSIKFDAFPFQKFGIAHGKVSYVSRNITFSSETASKLAFNEPVYKVKIQLEKQYIHAYGNNNYLIPGMLLQANINTGKRTLIEWLLEPILVISGY
ncbi:HlyD family efflux transporter periplasmic adaptor subunit [Shewanella sp. CG12_big_fil_rev_8_21_14_0_65_47_15]|uniref:HlyD family efflux transporter periplasmic adaptor subunit n=1 Tax=Shewanella sp. CG12_big_fil_rev_8_21_14_0_65_47_15 TaxID=1975537 RepID=UPI000CC525CA|nr:HlyD family efflux transporter periplasmic adaptor subunit [Shewanella sp. CG12_big_fil_rev_8_21_14_0_65_47_15]PIW61789.1 MAG: secretion protein HlyD [Shewanella sp. CG12_big_fil_rev_8_21_14_0_65_47_15]